MFDFFSENPVLGALAVGVIGYLAVRLNKRIDAKQKDALKTASKLSELGMPLSATIVTGKQSNMMCSSFK